MTRRTLTRRGLRLSYLDSAPDDAGRRVVLLLHGFPDDAEMWTPVAATLHEQGLRVLAPDIVGCGRSDIAPTLGGYRVREVLSDLIALLDEAGTGQADVVGHDWGAGIAWFLALRHPGRVRSLSVVSVGHPGAFVRGGIRQKLMSWYIGYFHLAPLADRLLPRGGPLGLRRVFGSHPDMDGVMARLREPGRMRAAVRMYRANIVRDVLFARHPRTSVPVLAVHSRDDVFLGARQVRATGAWVDGPFRFEQLDGGHWIPIEQPDRLATLILEHLDTVAASPVQDEVTTAAG